MDVTIYTVEDADGCGESSYWWPFEVVEAREYAQKYRLRLIANEYEFSDSYTVEDHTGGTP